MEDGDEMDLNENLIGAEAREGVRRSDLQNSRLIVVFFFFFLLILLFFLCFPEFCDQFLFGPFGDPRDSVYPGDGY